uniref:Uncharacterized protein n=1 Tax=Neogobius melanostomus TaxID=47308 RepID=A0A8C6SXI4_9GOBI
CPPTAVIHNTVSRDLPGLPVQQTISTSLDNDEVIVFGEDGNIILEVVCDTPIYPPLQATEGASDDIVEIIDFSLPDVHNLLETNCETDPDTGTQSHPQLGSQTLPQPRPQTLPQPDPQTLPQPRPQTLPQPRPQTLPQPRLQTLPQPRPIQSVLQSGIWLMDMV